MSWLAKQIGFDAQEEIPEIAPIDGFHSRVSGRYTSIAGGDSHHGHSHGGGDDHGHSHGGGGHGHGGQEPEEPVTVESACGQGDLAQVMLFYAQGIDLVHRSQPYGGAEACPLMWASLKGHLPVVKFLLDRGADVHFCTQDGQTALHWAVTEGRYDVVDALLRVGARPTDTDVRGYNAFFVAVQGANLGMVALLAEHAPLEANMRDSENHTLMHWAAYRGSIALCQYLHEINGVAIDTVDNLKRTPLIWAAREGHEQVCAYLLSKGARATSQDAEQQTALDYAKERAQRNVEVVLTSNLQEVATRRRAGTLRMIVLDRAALLSSLFGVGYVLTAFVGMLLLPPVVAHMAFGFYFGKNLIFSYLYRMPANHKSLQNMSDFRQIANMSGIPRSFGEAVQSADYLLRRREPANLFALLTFLAVQNVSLLTASIQLSPVYWVSLAVVLVSVWATKHLCMRSVVASGTIQDSAIIRFVRERKFRMLQARIVDQEKHIQLPLRAFYCFERDEIIRNYDSYSVALDAPIGEANLPWFAAFLLSFTALQLTVLCMAWSQTSAQFCETNARSGALWGVVFHALPCAIPPPDDTWWSFFFPSSLNSAGVWMIDYALVTFLFGVIVLGRVMGPLLFGCTRKELLNATVPTADGELVSLMRNGRPIFSEGAGFTNMLFLFTGRFGQRWRGLYSVPAPPTH